MTRDRVVSTKLNETEYANLEERAAEMDMSVSAYLRFKLQLARASQYRFKLLPVLMNDDDSPNEERINGRDT